LDTVKVSDQLPVPRKRREFIGDHPGLPITCFGQTFDFQVTFFIAWAEGADWIKEGLGFD
jgi:hypothetical protein